MNKTALAIVALLSSQSALSGGFTPLHPLQKINGEYPGNKLLSVAEGSPYFNYQGHTSNFPSSGALFLVRHMGKYGSNAPKLDGVNLDEIRYGVYKTPQWNPGNYTGLATHVSKQKGRYDVYGANAYQLDGYKFGAVNNTWSYEIDHIQGGGPNITYMYVLESDNIYPWARHDDLVMQVSNLKAPWINANGGSIAQLSFQAILKDITSGQSLHYIVGIYVNNWSGVEANRDPYKDGSCSDYVDQSSAIPPEPFVSTLIGRNTCYTKKLYSEMEITNQTWRTGKFARVHITRQNLINAIQKYNQQFGGNFSTNPNNYQLTHYGLFQESFVGTPGSNVSFAFSGSHVAAYGYDY